MHAMGDAWHSMTPQTHCRDSQRAGGQAQGESGSGTQLVRFVHLRSKLVAVGQVQGLVPKEGLLVGVVATGLPDGADLILLEDDLVSRI